MKRFVFRQTLCSATRFAALIFVLSTLPATVRAQAPEVFGFTPMPVPAQPDLSPYTKWTDMTRRMKEQKGWEDEDCASSFGTCPVREWRKVLGRAKSSEPKYQLDDVNRFLNRFDYVLDAVNWGGVDYWETPKEFFQKGGECKDYSIAKYFSLRLLGWTADKLWMIILQDMNLNVTHAVLAAKLGDTTYILDNQVPDMVDQARIHHYRPIFGLSEAGWVIYRPK
jgi:predicted transglutaminase-like cysteine proteinase